MKLLFKSVPNLSARLVFQERLAGAPEASEELRPQDILMIGDSHTVNMGDIAPNGTRVNAAVGRNITEMPAVLQTELERALPRVITIMGGTNDYLSPDTVITNLETMIGMAREHNIPVVIATLPPVNGEDLGAINARIRALGARDVTIVEVGDHAEGNMADSLHLADYGEVTADMLNAAYAASGQEMNTVADILRGRINPDAPVTDAAIEAAAAALADRIPRNLNMETIIDQAIDGLGGVDSDEDLGALADEVGELVDDLAETAELAELSAEDTERMQTISNREFLEIPMAERLRYITTENVTAPQVADGTVDSLTFTFTFDGQYNQDLWRSTTAGQVLPPEVRAVTSGGQVFRRGENSLQGEFFTESGQRLKIHENTNISSIETGDIDEIQARVDERLAAFEAVEEGEDPRSEAEMLVARMALERDIPPEFVMAAFVEQDHEIQTEDMGISAEVALTAAYRAELEDFLTESFRAEGDFNGRFSGEATRDGDRLHPNFAAYFLASSFDDATVGTIMEAVGYTSAEIEASADYRSARREFNSGGATNPLNAEILNSGEVEVVPAKRDQVNAAVEQCLANQNRYEQVSQQTGVPWELIAAIHYRESSFDFNTYLHNGDPLGRPTTHVPRGILCHTWEESAMDALQDKGSCPDDLLSMAHYAERYNGMGYDNRDMISPYVWAGHPSYESQGGMFVADGQFDRGTSDPRVGVMPIVMVLKARQGERVDGADLVS